MTDNSELILTHVKVLFAELKDKGFGRNITIDATDPTIKSTIESWVTANNINGGKVKFKDYTNKDGVTTTQYQLRLSDYTIIDGKNGETEAELGYGAIINLKARSFEYDNKFGKGVSANLKAIYIIEPRNNTALDGITE